MKNISLKGVFIGLIAPFFAFVVYVAYFTENPDPFNMIQELILIDRLSHVISLSLLINLLIFFMKIQLKKDLQARGILFSTILYGVIILYLKIF